MKEEKKQTAEQRKRISTAKKTAEILLKKSDKAFLSMNLTEQSQHFRSLPMSATNTFKHIFDEIKCLRERAQALRGLTPSYQTPMRAL